MARRKRFGRDVHGILLLDKRLGVSSNKALQEVRSLYQAKKAGHTGSLDPLASGLLPVCFGEATKVSAMMLDDDKRYQVTVKLGVVTDSGDFEGQVIDTNPVPELEQASILKVLTQFTGAINQVPPMYSALKHDGKRLYELARKGQVVERKARPVTIKELKLLDSSLDLLKLEVSCSKGTYIRSLAEDIGAAIGCGATVAELRRIGSGSFNIAGAYTLEQLQACSDQQELETMLLPVDNPLTNLPEITLAQDQAEFIRQGGRVVVGAQTLPGTVRMYDRNYFIGIGELSGTGELQPKRIFNIR